MRLFSALVFTVVLTALPTSSALADTIYTYTGNSFTTADSPFFTTSESIGGTVTFASPLSANLVDQFVTPDSFDFSDGYTTINSVDSLGSAFFVWTDSSGKIVDWSINLHNSIGGLSTESESGTGQDSATTTFVKYDPGIGLPVYYGASNTDPGTWTVAAVDDASAPEPSSLLLLGTGLIGGVGLFRRKAIRR